MADTMNHRFMISTLAANRDRGSARRAAEIPIDREWSGARAGDAQRRNAARDGQRDLGIGRASGANQPARQPRQLDLALDEALGHLAGLAEALVVGRGALPERSAERRD